MEWNESARKLAVWNMSDGIDVYDVQDGPSFFAKMTSKITRNYAIQLHFLDDDTLVSGSDNGLILVASIARKAVLLKLKHESFRK
jgi:hypothetical protein